MTQDSGNSRKLSAKLTSIDVQDIKKMIWDGYSQLDAARQYGITQSYVSLIAQGKAYYEIEWPDGSIGPIDQTHYRSLKVTSRKEVEHTLAPFMGDKGIQETVKDANLVESDEDREARLLKMRERREEMLKNIQLAGNELEHDLAANIKETIHKPGKKSKVERKVASGVEYDVLEWDVILEKAGELPLVQLAEDEPLIKKALQIAFNMIPEERWKEDATTKLVGQIAAHLKEELESG